MKVEEAYDNLENIITYGFLFRGVCYKGHTIILKTISDKEYNLLSLYSSDLLYDALFYRMAFSTFMIDGHNFLVDRNKYILELADFYRNISTVAMQNLKDSFTSLYEKYLKSMDFLEGFCYTNRSRALWRIFSKDTLSTKGSYYGIEGSEKLGLNNVQESWIIVNQQLDSEEDYETRFRLSLMVAGAFSGEGARKIESSYNYNKQELEELRASVSKYGYDKKRIIEEQKTANGWAKIPKTREDLVRELLREMSGDKDKHDLFIEKWLKNQKEAAEKVKKEAEEKQRIFREKIKNDIDLTKKEDSRIATPEEVEQLMKRRTVVGLGVSTDKEIDIRSASKDEVLKRMGSKIIKSTN